MAEVPPAVAVPRPDVEAPRPDEIMVAFAGPAPQRRLTVLLRMLLVIPHVIVLWALGLAAEVVVIIGWFAALFTGRLPQGMAGFLTGWLRWSARVYAYALLITDQYPPFELGDSEYPVRVAANPGALNRLAVFFRLLLAFPASMLVSLAAFGGMLASPVIWLIVLISGTMPRSLHEALAAALRYGTRYYGYSFLLTGTYPGGLFGDRPGASGLAGATDTGHGGSLSYGGPPPYAQQPPAAPPAYGQPPAEPPAYGQVGYGQAPGYAQAPPMAAPQSWRLVLSSGAKRLMALFLVLGVAGWIGYVVGIVALTSANQNANAAVQVESAHSALASAVAAFPNKIAACGQNITCVTRQDRAVAHAFAVFGASVRSTAMPTGAASAVRSRLLTDSAQVQADLAHLSHATSAADYRQILSGMNLQQTVNQFNSDYQRLGRVLTGS